MVGEQFCGSLQHSQLDEENYRIGRSFTELVSGIAQMCCRELKVMEGWIYH